MKKRTHFPCFEGVAVKISWVLTEKSLYNHLSQLFCQTCQYLGGEIKVTMILTKPSDSCTFGDEVERRECDSCTSDRKLCCASVFVQKQSSSFASSRAVITSDLRLSVDDFIHSKETTAPTTMDKFLAQFKQQVPQAEMQAPTPHQTAFKTTEQVAFPVVTQTQNSIASQRQAAVEARRKQVQKVILPPPEGGFGGLSNEFFGNLTNSLQQMGHDLNSESAMQKLANDPNLPAQLAVKMAGKMGGASSEVLKDMVRQWQKALKEQQDVAKEMKKKGRRPIWRCSVCLRYGCQYAPYIESYEEYDL